MVSEFEAITGNINLEYIYMYIYIIIQLTEKEIQSL